MQELREGELMTGLLFCHHNRYQAYPTGSRTNLKFLIAHRICNITFFVTNRRAASD